MLLLRGKELSKLTGAVNSLLFSGKDKVEDGAADEAEPRYQSITVKDALPTAVIFLVFFGAILGCEWPEPTESMMTGVFHGCWKTQDSIIYGNIIGGNSDSSSRNVIWRHDVKMPMKKDFAP